MPSCVDTTRLSPSISIIPMSSNSERAKPKSTTSPSPRTPTPSTTPTTSIKTPHTVPTASSSNNSASIQPPPLHHQGASFSNNNRNNTGVNNAQMPNMMAAGNRNTASIPSPNLRMSAPAPGLVMGNRMPGVGGRQHLPAEAGYLSSELNKHSHKLAEIMRATLEDVLLNLAGTGTPEAKLAALQLDLEKTNWRHQQEIIEVIVNLILLLFKSCIIII